MPFTNDPVNNPVDRLRLITGDIDVYEEGLTDEVYRYSLSTSDDNENKAALQCLRYLVAKYASFVTEKAGGLFTKESEKYQQYTDLLNKYTKDPSYLLFKMGEPYAGGISKSDYLDNLVDEDTLHNTSTLRASELVIEANTPYSPNWKA